ncbi:MAG: hypothetical protein ACF8OB_12075 [Phycisphaeraceae bacterium JB051]
MCEYTSIKKSDFLDVRAMDLLTLPIPSNAPVHNLFSGSKENLSYSVMLTPVDIKNVVYHNWMDLFQGSIDGKRLNEFRLKGGYSETCQSLPEKMISLLQDEYIYAAGYSEISEQYDFWKIQGRRFLFQKSCEDPSIIESFPAKDRYHICLLAGSTGNWELLIFDDDPFVLWIGKQEFIHNLSILNPEVMLEISGDWILYQY